MKRISFGPHSTVERTSVLVSFFAFYVILQFALSGPILEAYGINVSSRNYFHNFPSLTARPLSAFPTYVATLISGEKSLGFFCVGLFFGVAKTILVYLVSRKFNLRQIVLLMTILLFMPPWYNFMNERYFDAQLSMIFLLFGIYFWIKVSRIYYTIPLFVLAGLAYPPSILACFVAPLVIWFTHRSKLAFWGLIQSQIGVFSYLIFYFYTKIFIKKSYESIATGKLTYSNFFHIYQTAYLNRNWITLLIAVAAASIAVKSSKKNTPRIGIFCFLVIALPVSSLAFAGNSLYVNDVDRVLFPLIAALSGIFIGTFAFFENNEKSDRTLQNFEMSIDFLYIGIALIFLIPQVITWHNYFTYNHRLLGVVSQLKDVKEIKSVLIFDKTGYFGDVYTLYNDADVLGLALLGEGVNVSTKICNGGLNYANTVASRFPIPAASNCRLIDRSKFDTYIILNSLKPFNYSIVSGYKNLPTSNLFN